MPMMRRKGTMPYMNVRMRFPIRTAKLEKLMMTAAFGMAAGNALALLFCLVQGTTHWIKLNPENYFVSSVPVHVDLPGVLVADAAAFLGILLLLLIPTLFISRVDPARTVKAE